MHIKSFKGRTAAEALAQVKADMGPQAMVLQTRPLRDRGLLGLFAKTGVEIVAAIDDPSPKAPQPPKRSEAILQLRSRLVRQGVDPDQADELVEDVERVTKGQAPAQTGRLTAALADALGDKLRVTGGLRGSDNGRRVVAFVGPTGVGKTTTIAKIAADMTLRGRRRVELVTIDAHRVGAIEQLKTYGELLGLPVHAAYTSREFANIVAGSERADVILVDTPGCSYRDGEALVELEQYFRQVPGLEVNVLLSCCWRADDAILGNGIAVGTIVDNVDILSAWR